MRFFKSTEKNKQDRKMRDEKDIDFFQQCNKSFFLERGWWNGKVEGLYEGVPTLVKPITSSVSLHFLAKSISLITDSYLTRKGVIRSFSNVVTSPPGKASLLQTYT